MPKVLRPGLELLRQCANVIHVHAEGFAHGVSAERLKPRIRERAFEDLIDFLPI